VSVGILIVQGNTPLDSLLEYYRRSVDELSADEVVRVKDVENQLRTKMRSGVIGIVHVYSIGRVTMTTESSENGAITLPRMNLSAYVGRDDIQFNAYCCMLSGSTVRVRIRFNVWLFSGYAHCFPWSLSLSHFNSGRRCRYVKVVLGWYTTIPGSSQNLEKEHSPMDGLKCR